VFERVFSGKLSSTDMLWNGHDHLMEEKGIALAVCERIVHHVPDALDPHT
jgi:hypothetical protein